MRALEVAQKKPSQHLGAAGAEPQTRGTTLLHLGIEQWIVERTVS